MVRQASCDVSDRNDKGSPDTVWQILGSYCGSFSCSKTSAAQTQDPAPASRKETLQSESGKALPSARKGSSPCFSPVSHRPVLLSTSELGSWAVGRSRCTDTWARRWGPSMKSVAPHSTPAGAALLRHALTQAHTSNGRAKMLLSVQSSRKAKGMRTPSWPGSTEICPLGDLSRPLGPLRGVRRHRSAFTPAPNTGRLYPHSLANCSGPN